MDRNANLEVLAEEDDEHAIMSGADSEEDESGDGGIRRGEPNKFDSLCDGVLNTLALVHGAMQEFLEMKDVLLESSLPPNVLTKVSLTSTKLFRSIGDMHMPVNELIRVVKLYSTPWEEKSTALKKLHDGYEAKKSQLDIAIKRLQLVDAQSRRMHREKRIMNWEKLFCRITTARGHGRRWKFLIDSFKKKAKEGIPALQRYLDAMENASDSEEEEETSDFPVETQMQQMSEPEEETSEESEQEDDSSQASTAEPLSEFRPPAPVEIEPVQTFIKPPMKDQQCGTSDPTYDRFLYVKVFNPQGLDKQQVKCSLTCGKESYKTSVLDAIVENETADDNKTVVSQSNSEDQAPAEKAEVKPKRGRGLIGSRSSKGSVTSDKESPSPKLEDGLPKQDRRFEEMLFGMPEISTVGSQKGRRRSSVNPEHLRVSVHHGPMDELLAMATIEIADLNTLDLPSVILPPDPLSADAVDDFDLLSLLESDSDNESTTKSNRSRDTPSEAGSKFTLPANYRDVSPVNFPLYSIHGGPSDAVHVPCGQLPLVCFWAKKLQPKKFHKMTEADTLNEIVLDLTGINMEEVTKEDLHPDMVERCISAMSAKSEVVEVKEETVTRKDYDRLMRTHQEEMEMLQDEYEQRLQDLAESMQHMQMLSINNGSPQRPQSSSRPRSRSSNGTSPSRSERHDERIPHPPHLPKETRVPTENAQKPKRSGIGKSLPNWGENLPKNFLERLRWFEELNNKHRQELSEKTNKEISDNYEKKLAGEFKLRGHIDDENSANPLDDVSLPAVFMPSKGRDLTIYNPRASKYFHATGAGGLRLTQPPSMVTLPPLPKSKVNVVNLFDVCNNFRSGGNEWLIQRYMQQEQQQQQQQRQEDPGDADDESYDADPLATYQSTQDPNLMAREAIYPSGSSRRKEAILE